MLHLGLVALAILSLLGGGKGSKQGADGAKASEGTLKFKGVDVKSVIEKDKATEVAIIEKGPNPRKLKHKGKKAIKDCPGAWYGGIGVQMEYAQQGEKIYRIYSGYPADLAGLRVGDIIVSISDTQVLGDPGTSFKAVVLRGEKMFTVVLTRGKICY
jgi:S1-C subfamily serine protease